MSPQHDNPRTTQPYSPWPWHYELVGCKSQKRPVRPSIIQEMIKQNRWKKEVDNVNNEERKEKLLQMTQEQIENSHRKGQEGISWEWMWQDHWISKDRTLRFNVHEDKGTRLHSMENSLRKGQWTWCKTDCRINECEVLLVLWETDDGPHFAQHVSSVHFLWHYVFHLSFTHGMKAAAWHWYTTSLYALYVYPFEFRELPSQESQRANLNVTPNIAPFSAKIRNG